MNSLLHHDNAPSHITFFTTEFFTKNNMIDVFTNLTFLFPRLQIKLKGSHFDTVEVMEAESQAVLNTLIEHDFQHAFKKWRKSWERCIRMKEDGCRNLEPGISPTMFWNDSIEIAG
jgi:hypothetical protein